MDNTKTMRSPQTLSFLHHIRLVPLFSSILGGIILLFALSSALAGYFLLQADTDLQDVTSEIQVRTGLSNSSNHLRTARINMIHAGAASRIAERDAMKQNIAEAETRIKQSQESFAAYMNRAVRTPADEALDGELKTRFDAYITGLQPMLKYAKNGMFEAIINHENESARPLDDGYNEILLKAIKKFNFFQRIHIKQIPESQDHNIIFKKRCINKLSIDRASIDGRHWMIDELVRTVPG